MHLHVTVLLMVLLERSSAEEVEVPGLVRNELIKELCRDNCSGFAGGGDERCDCHAVIDADLYTAADTNGVFALELFCIEDNFMTIEFADDAGLKLIELKSAEDENWLFYKVTYETRLLIKNLTQDTEYQIRAWKFEANATGLLVVEMGVRTLKFDHVPAPVREIYVSEIGLDEEEGDYRAIVKWKKPSDYSCYYESVWFAAEDVSDYSLKEIRDPLAPHELIISELEYDTNYTIAIITKGPNFHTESEKVFLHFITAPCEHILQNMSHCIPQKPKNLHITEMTELRTTESHMLDITISWDKPETEPEYYIALFLPYHPKVNITMSKIRVWGNETEAKFENVYPGLHYQITLIAYSAAGASHPSIIHEASNVEISSKAPKFKGFVLLLVIGLSVFVCAVIVAFFYVRFRRRIEKKKAGNNYFRELEMKPFQSNSFYSDSETKQDFKKDEWEIRSMDLILLSVLGEGAFGVVRKALLSKGNTNKIEVAVKMLKDNPNGDEVRQFRQEIDIMKSVGKHPNIVSMIGCITNEIEGLKLIVEYCAKGDLLSYLRKIGEALEYGSESQCSDDPDQEEPIEPLQFANKTYLMDDQPVDQLNIKDLISIARQITSGMEYLSSLKVVHRDLAARNVLVCADNTVKVSDFGLSRDVYKDNVYLKLSNGKLPLRWMAIESLTHQRYTTKSDVWSYGVLLWEIFTFGGNPYPDIMDMHRLLEGLKSGVRMTCPNNCSEEMYTLMLNCWKESPKDRPSFSDIRKYLDILLENMTAYLNLNSDDMSGDSRSSQDDEIGCMLMERYVRPIIN